MAAARRALFQSLLAAIPNFHGTSEENVTFFLKNITDTCNVQKLDDQNCILVLRLKCRDKALEFLSSDTEVAKETEFQKIIDLFQKKFHKAESFEDASYEYARITQKPKQTVTNLAEEIRSIVTRMSPTSENNAELTTFKEKLMFSKFLEALRPDIRIEVIKFGKKNFKDLVAQALDVEKALEQKDFDLNNLCAVPSTSSDLIEKLLKQQAEQNVQISKLTDTIQKIQEEKVTCQICFKTHSARDCWHYLGVQNQRHFRRNPHFSNQAMQSSGGYNSWGDNSNSQRQDNRNLQSNGPRYNRGRGRNQQYRPYNHSDTNLNY